MSAFFEQKVKAPVVKLLKSGGASLSVALNWSLPWRSLT